MSLEHLSCADPPHAAPVDALWLPAATRGAPSGTARQIDVDIGVVYTYEDHFMPRLLATLAASAPALRTRLLLVDNRSEGGAQRWTSYFPSTLVLHNPRRLGYAPNLNRIVAAASARYVLLLNTDMYFDPAARCLARMTAFMDAHPRCGIAGCALYHADGEFAYPARRFQTPRTILARRVAGLGRLMRRTLDEYLYRDRPIAGTWPCDWLSGCFLMVRREAIEDVGPFDESFGKYFEDVDICLRMARRGWQVMYHGATYGYHLERRGSTNPFSLDALRHLRAYLRWNRKWGLTAQALPQTPQRRRQAA